MIPPPPALPALPPPIPVQKLNPKLDQKSTCSPPGKLISSLPDSSPLGTNNVQLHNPHSLVVHDHYGHHATNWTEDEHSHLEANCNDLSYEVYPSSTTMSLGMDVIIIN